MVVGNLHTVQKKWVWVSRILGMGGSNKGVLGNFFKVVVKAVLLFG